MLIEAYVKRKINDYTFECLVAINRLYTREQQFMLYPLNKKRETFDIEDIVHRSIYIWKHPYFKQGTNYLGKIIYMKENKLYFINQGFEEILKKIE
jgi:hypothetical protein